MGLFDLVYAPGVDAVLVAEDGGVEGRFLVALFLLLDIVEQGDARVLGEADDGVEVG